MIPIAITLGFSGPRKWADTQEHSNTDDMAISGEVEAWLIDRIRRLPEDLGLHENHFICGVSQIAICGDIAFTRACKTLHLPQKVLLPQHRDAYFDASEPNGTPDFSTIEKSESLALLESSHIVEDRLVSVAPARQLRFEETNFELVCESDLLICLKLHGADAKPGGTQDVVARAAKANKPVLLVTVNANGGKATFKEQWIGSPSAIKNRHASQPALLSDISGPNLPAIKTPDGFPCADRCLQFVLNHSEQKASRHSRFFKFAAVVVVGTHCMATLFAAAAIKMHSQALLLLFLGIEIVLLLIGYLVHHHLHHRAAASRWAFHRLVSEISRSVLSLNGCHHSLEHLHALPLPDAVRPYLRTIEILHLRSSRNTGSVGWQQFRDKYLCERLSEQLVFYDHQGNKAKRLHGYAHRFFVCSSLLAIVCTAIKVVFVLFHLTLAGIDASDWKTAFGFLAVILPVVAVGALSLAAANDLEARHHSFNEMYRFLLSQKENLMAATSSRESTRLVIDTESRLIGETANWFSRRSFTGVA